MKSILFALASVCSSTSSSFVAAEELFSYARPDAKWQPGLVPQMEATTYDGSPPVGMQVDFNAFVQEASQEKEQTAFLELNSHHSLRTRHNQGVDPAAGAAGAAGAAAANADDGRNPSANKITDDPDSFASILKSNTKKVPHSWFGKGNFLAPEYQIATGKEECDVCKALIEHSGDLHSDVTYNPGMELATKYRGMYGKISLATQRAVQAARKAGGAGTAAAAAASGTAAAFLEMDSTPVAGTAAAPATVGGTIVSEAEENEFNFLMAGIKPEYFDMAAGFETYLTTCPSFKNNLCHEDLGGSERLRSPCPLYLQCYYCLRINPLYCLGKDDDDDEE